MDEGLHEQGVGSRGVALDFDVLYQRHASFVRSVLARSGVRSTDLDDLTQETFARVHRLLPAFEGRSSIKTWLHAIAWRVSVEHRRRAYFWREREAPIAASLFGASEEPAHADDASPAMWDFVDPEQRDLLALHHVGGFSISQLSALTGHARATIRKRLAQAKMKLARNHDTLGAGEGAALRGSLHIAEQPTADAAIQVLSCQQVCISSLDDIVIGLWRGPCTAESMRALGQAFAAALALRPEGIRYLAIVEPTSSPPKLEARKLHADLAHTYGPKLRAAATTVETSTMMRFVSGVLNAYFAIARTAVHIRFFSDLESAVAWLEPYGATAPACIMAHVELMRAQLR
jgi:RNA polymerase sigma-70 factor (ECF subfamily)